MINFKYIINNAETEEVKTRAQDVLKWLNTCCFDNKKSLGSAITAEVKEAVNKELSKQRELFRYVSSFTISGQIYMFRQFLEDVENLEKKKEEEIMSKDPHERKMRKMILAPGGGRKRTRRRKRRHTKKKRRKSRKKRRKRRRRRTRKRK